LPEKPIADILGEIKAGECRMANYFLETHHHEWLLTNRLGGYALGTGNLVNQRKYHGLLIAGYPHLERVVLVSSLEETVEWRGDSFHLDSNNYVDCIYPEGFLHLVKSWLRPYPVFLYSAFPHNETILIRKELMLDADTNTVLVRYTNLGQHSLHLTIRPKLALRNHHELNPPGTWDEEPLNTIVGWDGPNSFHTFRAANGKMVNGYVSDGEWKAERVIYRNVSSPLEIASGYEGVCDLMAPVVLDTFIKAGQTIKILFTDRKLTMNKALKIEKLYGNEPHPADYPDSRENLLASLDYDDHDLYDQKQYRRILEIACRDFIQKNDVIAGFPWFGSWGRDTMIFLQSALCLPDGPELAWNILSSYGKKIRNGLIPNVLPESFARTNYDSIDASLWFVAVLRKTTDALCAGIRKKADRLPVHVTALQFAKRVMDGILAEQKHFNVAENGLIELSESFANATWMDARIGKECVTPRNGAPIEVNALWYNALLHYRDLIAAHNADAPKSMRFTSSFDPEMLANTLHGAFSRFWLEDYAADRLSDGRPVAEIRPNVLIAASLDFDVFTREQMTAILEKVRSELLTPYGVRTLSPFDYSFHKKYFGPQHDRDLAYHQGTVWAWLLGPYARAVLKVETPETAIKCIEDAIFVYRNGFIKGHIASVAQVMDGDKPHFPKGAPAHAVATAVILDIETTLSRLKGK
jgi:predicted glycogen debranching enzyme